MAENVREEPGVPVLNNPHSDNVTSAHCSNRCGVVPTSRQNSSLSGQGFIARRAWHNPHTHKVGRVCKGAQHAPHHWADLAIDKKSSCAQRLSRMKIACRKWDLQCDGKLVEPTTLLQICKLRNRDRKTLHLVEAPIIGGHTSWPAGPVSNCFCG
ncbi:hypothetical protein GCM10011410_16490 [Hoyosella rhizosphaerae]|uniref:Uncharacterized protein n=1 Tax=Hoyosella rhizosphaerae TaxID=1755582 RepID=A0A916U8Q1_9ACTN|nr:hypothetical protein GCM10011410_16490 [Hoyosella rhizosphaerae]